MMIFAPIATVNASAIDASPSNFVLSISNPETGEVWEFDLTEENIQSIIEPNICEKNRSNATDSVSSIELNITDYVLETLSASDKSKVSTLEDDITISAGMTYNYNTVSGDFTMKTVFGSTITSGDFWASDKHVVWRNPGAWLGSTAAGEYYPTGDSFNYTLPYSCGPAVGGGAEPYVTYFCRINITGMTAYRDIGVTCSADFI